MCRPKSQGGRRCPSHSDPVKRAARNAKKRELYNATKNSLMANQAINESGLGSGVGNAARANHFEASFFSRTYNDRKISDLVKPKNVSKESAKINIKHFENEGELVDQKYFADRTVEGVINYNNIDENSYKEFGFSDIDPDTYYENREVRKLATAHELSKLELESLSEREQKALVYFTSNNFEWFNAAIYSGGESLDPNDRYKTYTQKDYDFVGNLEKEDKLISQPKLQTEQTANAVAEELDKALENGPGAQRIVYRGVNRYNFGFKGTTIEAWTEENIKLGKEIMFDGYQSSSINPNAAFDYTGEDGLFYEILTPEGVNVTSISQYDAEQEVVLPRQSRYMIVGVHKGVTTSDYKKNGSVVVRLVAINEKGEVLTGTNSSPKTEIFQDKNLKEQ